MKVVLVPPLHFTGTTARPQIPLGLLRIAQIVIEMEEDISFIDPYSLDCLKGKKEPAEIRKIIADAIIDESPDLIGFSTTGHGFKDILLISKYCKEFLKNTKIVMGGPQASATAEDLLNAFPWIDIIVKGEGETGFRKILLNIKNGKSLPERGFIEKSQNNDFSMNELTLPPFAKYPKWEELKKNFPVPIETARGCIHTCKFCYGVDFWENRIKRQSINKAIDDISNLHTSLGIDKIKIIQDNFFAGGKYFFQFCSSIKKRRLPVKWQCMGSPDLLTDEILYALTESGCKAIWLGMEHGEPAMRKKYTKNYDNFTTLNHIRQAKSFGIRVICSFIIGFPGETAGDVKKTFDLMADSLINGAEFAGLYLLEIVPGSQIYREYKNELLYDDEINFGLPLDDATRKLITGFPDIFPLYRFIKTDVTRDIQKMLISVANKQKIFLENAMSG